MLELLIVADQQGWFEKTGEREVGTSMQRGTIKYIEKPGHCSDGTTEPSGFKNFSEAKKSPFECSGACRTFDTRYHLQGSGELDSDCYSIKRVFNKFMGKCMDADVSGITSNVDWPDVNDLSACEAKCRST